MCCLDQQVNTKTSWFKKLWIAFTKNRFSSSWVSKQFFSFSPGFSGLNALRVFLKNLLAKNPNYVKWPFNGKYCPGYLDASTKLWVLHPGLLICMEHTSGVRTGQKVSENGWQHTIHTFTAKVIRFSSSFLFFFFFLPFSAPECLGISTVFWEFLAITCLRDDDPWW